MISDINEILKITENITEENRIILIYKNNDLNNMLVWFNGSWLYSKKIKFQGCRITLVYCEFNNVKIRIETQCLLKSDLNGLLTVDDEIIYNKMNECMREFNKSIS